MGRYDKNTILKKFAVAVSLVLFIIIFFMGCRNMLAEGISSDASELNELNRQRADKVAESGIYVSITDDYSYHFDGTGTGYGTTSTENNSDIASVTSSNKEDDNSDGKNSADVESYLVSNSESESQQDISVVRKSGLESQPVYTYEDSQDVNTSVPEEDEEEGITQTVVKNDTTVTSTTTTSGDTDTSTSSAYHKHQYRGTVTKKPTCTEDGVVTYTCVGCDDTYTETQNATGHNYVGNISTEPTCYSKGVKTYTCSLCGDTYTEEIDMLEHTYGDVYDGGDGYTYKKCSVCGDVVVDDVISYSITYDSNGGTLSDYVISYTVEDYIELPVPQKDGYTFYGWEKEDGSIITSIAIGSTGDLSLKAVWSGNPAIVSFVYNENIVYTLNSVVGNVIGTLPDMEVEGTVFTGWSTSADGGVVVTEDYVIADESMTLYAVFDEEVETITITDSVANEITSYTVVYGESIGELTYTEHDGYTFTGFVDSEGNTVTEDTIVSSNMTITAEYEVISYDITYVLNGGSETTQNPASYTVNDSFYLVSPQKEGYYFTGWTGSNGDTPSKSVKIASGTTGELTFTANWSARTDTAYSVEHLLEQLDGSYVVIDTDYMCGTSDAAITPNVNTYDGYTSPNEQTVTISADGSTVVTYKYTLIHYEITYELDGGVSDSNPETYTVLDEITLEEPTKSGYGFVEWVDDSGNSCDGTIPKGTTGSLYFEATWNELVAYLVSGPSFNYNLKILAGHTDCAENTMIKTSDTTISAIARASELDSDATYTCLSTSDSDIPVYAWFDSDTGTIYWYTEAERLYTDSDASSMFRYLKSLTSVDMLSYMDTSCATDMSYMFHCCTSLADFTLNSFVTSNVTNMTYMFQYCKAVVELDLSSFDTSNVLKMTGMFEYCSLLSDIDVSSFNTSSVTSFFAMFDYCTALTEIDVSGFDTSNGTNFANMFNYCTALTSLDLSNFNTSNGTKMSYMFRSCKSLTSLDLSSFDTSNVTGFEEMFSLCSKLMNISGIENFNTSKVTTMYQMFKECSSLTELDVSTWDTSNVTNMSGMFYACSVLMKLDVSGFNTGKCKSMNSMFSACYKLDSIDVSSFDTSSCTNFAGMFSNCYKVTELDVSGFDTSKATTLNYMFRACGAITSLDLSSFNTSCVSNMSGMFRGCSALTTITGIEDLDTSNVTSMSYMFESCKKLGDLDLSSWNVSNLTSCTYLFCSVRAATTINITNWDTSNVSNMAYMFSDCTSLTTIYASDTFVTTGLSSSCVMFSGTSSLVGGNGTVYSSDNTSSAYAVIDTDDTPGYFTEKQ